MTPPRPMPGAINMQTPPRQAVGGQAPNPSLSRMYTFSFTSVHLALRTTLPTPDAKVPLAPSIPPPQRHWYDRIVDAVLGEDTESPHTRFALICQRCFTHNGLVREAELENTRTSSLTYFVRVCTTILMVWRFTRVCVHEVRPPEHLASAKTTHGDSGAPPAVPIAPASCTRTVG